MITADFLLDTPTAQRMYHDHAAACPIIDYHSHLDSRSLADDRKFATIAELWIATDPYKHRAMRIAGVPERLITGEASDWERFEAWAATVPLTLGNPLYHWTALELKRYFDIDLPLSSKTAKEIWEACNRKLQEPTFSARQFLIRANVEVVCTSDQLDDDLKAHQELADGDISTRILPSIRDAEKLSKDSFDRFESLGCRVADHAISSAADFDGIRAVAMEYARRGWVMQLHLGAQRETSSRLRSLAGPAGGYASIGNSVDIPSLVAFLDDLEKSDSLPRTIIFPLNPADNAALATLTGSFAEDGVRGKIQFGPAWWYNDHLFGMRQHLEALSHYGLLSTFVGMTTDSRSLLSMVRHEYFRRILCAWIGEQVAAGLFPDDDDLLSSLVRSLCYENAKEYFNL